MIYNAVLTLSKPAIKAINQYFSHPFPGEKEPTLSWSVSFGNGYETDYKVCPASGDEEPWVEVVAFANGGECGCSEPMNWTNANENYTFQVENDVLILMVKKELPQLDSYPMPDPDIPANILKELCFYTGNDLFPVSQKSAKDFCKSGLNVFAFAIGKPENTRVSRGEYLQKENVVFAVTRTDWECCSEFHQAILARLTQQNTREQALLTSTEDSFGIYQIKKDDNLVPLRFMGLQWLKKEGLSVNRKNYDLVYTAPLAINKDDNISQVLENLYIKFNLSHPSDYHNSSVNVSDVIVIHHNGTNSAYYVNNVGFEKLSDFF